MILLKQHIAYWSVSHTVAKSTSILIYNVKVKEIADKHNKTPVQVITYLCKTVLVS